MKKAAALLLAATVAISLSACAPPPDPNMREMTTQEIIRDMGIGINLGNTFESNGTWINSESYQNYEIAWGSPIITKEMIDGYAAGGFGVVRVPVNWTNLMADDYTISTDIVARIQQIVTWIIDAGMYAIINIHHENWIAEMPQKHDECVERYSRFWEQISYYFSGFSDYLMFESQNEDGGWDSVWNSYGSSDEGKAEAFGYLNELNQEFVDIVRSSGGYNDKRHLLIAGYYTAITHTCDELFKMPEDTAERCAVSVHYYNPSNLTLIEEDVSWGKARTDWGTEQDYQEMNELLNMLTERFVNNGIPVIVGEYGCFGKNKEQEVIRKYTVDVCSAIYERNMLPILWDTPNVFYNRYTCKFNDEELLSQMMAIKE